MTRENIAESRVLDLGELSAIIVPRLWIPVVCALALGALALIGAFLQTPVFRGDAVTMVVESETSVNPADIAGFPSMLAGLAGISSDNGRLDEILATLEARSFLARFLQNNGLVPEIVEGLGWECDAASDECLRMAVIHLRDEAIEIEADVAAGIIDISVHWIEPEAAAEWTNLLVDELNAVLREHDFKDAEASIAYLTGPASATNLNEVRAAIYALLEQEHRKLMLVNAREEYALRFIDPAIVPIRPAFPNKPLYLAIGLLLGGLLGLLYLLILAGTPRGQSGRA